jgi:sodium-coupled neutral amino acid transporter 10
LLLLLLQTYQGIGSPELVTDYIPSVRFNIITCCIIASTLVVGILVPDIELVLGIVGSTMG